MKTRYKIIGAAIGFGLLFWCVDAVLEYLFFYEGRSLIGWLITDVPSPQIYIRGIVLAHFIIFGVLVAMVIAKREQAQERVAHLYRVLRAIRNVNQLIVREKDRARLIQGACEHLTESRGYHSAWIILLDDAGKVTLTAQSGLNGRASALLVQLQRDELPVCGVQTLAQGEAVIIPNPATTCADCPLAANYVGHSAITVRLAYADQVYGMLAISLPAHLTDDEEEQALLREVAGDIAFALHSIDLEAARARAEAALRESEKKFKHLFEHVPIGLSLTAPTGEVQANRAFYEMLGYSRHHDSLTWQVITHPDDVEESQAMIEALMAGEKVRARFIKRYVHKDGAIVWAEISTAARQDEDGRTRYFMTAVQDITERKQTEEALRESEKRFRTVLENLPGGLFLHDFDGHLLWVNELAAKNTGYSQDELLNMTVADIDPRSVTRDDRAHLWRELDEGKTITLRSTHIRKDGSPYPVEVYLSNITLKGEPVILGVAMDITPRERAEAALRESERQKGLILNASAEMIAYYDTDLRVIWANRAAAESVGASPGDLVGMHCYEIWQQRDAPCHECPVLKARDRKKPWQGEQQTLDGRHWYIRGYPVLDEAGEVIALVEFGEDITERKQAEAALRESEARFRWVYENIAVGLAQVSMDFVIERANAAYCRMLGYSEEELIGKHLRDITHPEIVEENLRQQSLLAAGEIDHYRMEKRFIHQDGHMVYGILDANLIRDAEDRPLYFIGGVVDITERKAAEQALRESEERFRLTFQTSPDAININRLEDGLYVDINEGFTQLTGYTREDVIGKTSSEIDIWHNPAARQKLVEGLRERGYYKNLEAQFSRKDGSVTTALMSARIISLQGVPHIISITRDITKRKQMEEERARLATQVREQARQMEQILATVPTGVLLLDAEWRVLQANPTAKGDLAKLADVGVGDVLTQLGNRPLAELLTSPPTRGLWHDVRADASTFEVIARSMPVSTSADEDPAAEQWVLVINDVTREREIRSQLQQQERLAAVGQMAAGIAHDFNNIMAVVVLYAQLGLRTPNLPAKIGERLEIITQQAKRATELIEQILDFSRRTMLERRPIDLLPLLKEQVKLLERTLPEHIEIELDYEPDAYTILADPTRIQQMIMNLAVNARDAMPEGGVLRIAVERIAVAPDQTPPLLEMRAGDWVRLTVADTGAGIPSPTLPHIFEPFFTTKEPGKGSGLGLPQVHGIVGLHGGYIDVETRVGKGTVFTIYFPALVEEPIGESIEDISEMPQGHDETILVVEDENTVRAALAATLEQLGYQVLAAANGQEALKMLALRADEISLVLSDFVMPIMGGRALFGAMRQRGYDLPVVLLSGHPLEDELREMQDQGLADWMLKPPDIEQLAKVLAQVLQDQGVGNQ